MPERRRCAPLALLAACLAGCSGAGPGAPAPEAGTAAGDVAVRSTPVVPGRPARVFIMAGIGKSCEQIAEPQIALTDPPAKGVVTFQPGQETTIQYSVTGACIGAKAIGTGIYYTANAGETGSDRFSISAKLASGEIASRSFEVKIAE